MLDTIIGQHSTRTAVAATALAVIACTTPEPPLRIAIADGEEPVSAAALTCSKPVALTRDCSNWSGATRRLQIGGGPIAIAASDDGTRLLVMEPEARVTMKSRYEVTRINNAAAQRTIDALARSHVAVRHARPLISLASVFGYLLELDGDGYDALVAADESASAAP